MKVSSIKIRYKFSSCTLKFENNPTTIKNFLNKCIGKEIPKGLIVMNDF